MDLGDPRESLVSLNTPGTWEADNRVEERWQWGAQLLDLCNLSPEDYKNSTTITVKGTVVCSGCSGGGGGQVSQNKGTATLSDNGQFTISFTSPVATTLYAFVTFEDGLGNEYSFMVKLDEGSESVSVDISQFSSVSPYKITGIELGFNEDGSDAGETAKDDKYEYSATYGGGTDDATVYAFSILCTKTDSLTGADYKDMIDAGGQGFDYVDSFEEIDFGGVDTAQVGFTVVCQEVDSWMPEDVEAEYFAEHSYDFVFLTKKTIEEIKEDFTTDTENWNVETITIDGESYHKWLRRDISGAQCPYYIAGGPVGDDFSITYTVKIKK